MHLVHGTNTGNCMAGFMGLGETMKPDLRRALSCGVAASAIMLAQAASADDFTIVAGQPVTTTTQILDTEGDVGTVEAGGVIDVPNGNGIQATADGVIVDNAGDVTGTGAGFAGIRLLNGNTVTNSGTATSGTYGILAEDDNTVTNSGTATGGDSGILVFDNNTVSNSGTATGGPYGILAGNDNTIDNSGTATGGTFGILAGDDNTITNSGTATGTGSGSYGIFAGSDNSIANSGTAKGADHGIYVFNDNTIVNSGMAIGLSRYGIHGHNFNTITNSGVAKSSGVNSSGIYVDNSNIISNSGLATGDYGIWAGGDNTITNSGTIAGESAAVRLDGDGNTLKLLAGSNIQGNLDLGDGNTLNIGAGLNTALAYTGTPTIETGGLPTLVGRRGLCRRPDRLFGRRRDGRRPDRDRGRRARPTLCRHARRTRRRLWHDRARHVQQPRHRPRGQPRCNRMGHGARRLPTAGPTVSKRASRIWSAG
jgi:hypothetical protein